MYILNGKTESGDVGSGYEGYANWAAGLTVGTHGTSIGGAWWERIDLRIGGTLRKAHEMHCNGLK